MNKRLIKYGIIAVIASIAIIYMPLIYTITLSIMQVEPAYKEPEMSLEEYNIKQGVGYSSFTTTNIQDVKDQVLYTIRGEVIAIREPIIWLEKGGMNEHAFIPVDISIKEVYKGDLKRGDLFTVYVDSVKTDYSAYPGFKYKDSVEDVYFIPSYEARYRVGEDVIVHISKEDPEILREAIDSINKEDEYIIDKYYTTALVKYGKYTIKDGLAYNEEKYPYGIPIPYVAYEALP